MKIILALMGGGFSILAAWASVWFKNRMEQQKDRRKNAIGIYASEVHEIYTIIGQLKHDIKADRVLILKVTNGGGIPTAGCTLYSSVVWESFSKTLKSMRSRWDKQILDENYIGLVAELFQKKHKVVITEELEEGVLRDLYEAQKIVGADVHFLQNSEGVTLYLAAHFIKDFDPEKAIHKDLMRQAITKIKHHVSQMNYE